MNKFLKNIAISSLLILSLTGAAAAEIKALPLNSFFIEAENKELKKSSAEDNNYGYFPSSVDWDYLDKISVTEDSELRYSSTLPSRYDNRPRMTPVRNQNIDGPCWAHAAVTAAGASLMTKGILAPAAEASELSEWYLVYYAYRPFNGIPSFFTRASNFYNNGGNDWMAVALLAKGAGAVLLSDAPTPSAGMRDSYVPPVMNRKFRLTAAHHLGLNYKKEVPIKLNNTFNYIKRAIIENGAVSAGINWQNGCTEPSTAAYYSNDTYIEKTNHGIALVGWDDSYPVTNFPEKRDYEGNITHHRPSRPGAWIIKNSWGEESGDNGYYYVSYEEESLCDGVAYVMETAPANETIYQYDPLGCLTFLIANEIDGPVHIANMFVAKSNANQIDSVAFYTAVRNQTADITIKTGNTSSPDTGKKALTQRVTLPKQGYNTVKLSSPVRITPGEKFSVEVTYYGTGNGNIFIPVEGKYKETYKNATSKRRQSWYAKHGMLYSDFYGEIISEIANMNFCIKAIDSTAQDTGEDPTPPPAPEPPIPFDEGGGGCSSGFAGILTILLLPFVIKRKY